jgi:hypothetical protein
VVFAETITASSLSAANMEISEMQISKLSFSRNVFTSCSVLRHIQHCFTLLIHISLNPKRVSFNYKGRVVWTYSGGEGNMKVGILDSYILADLKRKATGFAFLLIFLIFCKILLS